MIRNVNNARPEHRLCIARCLQKLRSQRRYRPLQKSERKAIYDLRFEFEAADGGE